MQRQLKRKEKGWQRNKEKLKESSKSLNTPEIVAAQMEAKKAYKARWTMDACEEQGQHLHDFIKQGRGSGCKSLYLGKQSLICKRNQQIAIAKLKSKRAKSKYGTPILQFELPGLLLHFHGVREHLLENRVHLDLVRPSLLLPYFAALLQITLGTCLTLPPF